MKTIDSPKKIFKIPSLYCEKIGHTPDYITDETGIVTYMRCKVCHRRLTSEGEYHKIPATL